MSASWMGHWRGVRTDIARERSLIFIAILACYHVRTCGDSSSLAQLSLRRASPSILCLHAPHQVPSTHVMNVTRLPRFSAYIIEKKLEGEGLCVRDVRLASDNSRVMSIFSVAPFVVCFANNRAVTYSKIVSITGKGFDIRCRPHDLVV